MLSSNALVSTYSGGVRLLCIKNSKKPTQTFILWNNSPTYKSYKYKQSIMYLCKNPLMNDKKMNFPVYFIKVEICVNLTAYNKQIIKKRH
jgi:hypothetical protein